MTEDDVLAVFRFRLEGWGLPKLAAEFDTSRGYIRDIITGRRRASVAPDNADRVSCIRAEKAKIAARKRHAAVGVMTEAIKDYLKRGLSLRAAAKLWGVPVTTLQQEMVKRGARRRSANKRSP